MSIDDVLDCEISIDDVIKHCEEVAEEQENLWRICPASESELFFCDGHKDCTTLANGKDKGCLKCAEEHRQLAEWLKDYKELLKKIDNIECQMRTILEGDERTFSKREIEPYKDGYFDGIYECIKIFREKLKGLPTYDQVMGLV